MAHFKVEVAFYVDADCWEDAYIDIDYELRDFPERLREFGNIDEVDELHMQLAKEQLS
jgi:hypothetical protein